jgi:hypothetical protein
VYGGDGVLMCCVVCPCVLLKTKKGEKLVSLCKISEIQNNCPKTKNRSVY